ncbi:MAG TPA: GGDEF domain-containing protein, partial [Gammaproteobacteria bacterium]
MSSQVSKTAGSMEMETSPDPYQEQPEAEAENLSQHNERTRSISMFDPELGIGSPEAMRVELEHTHNMAVRYARLYSVAIFDIDTYSSYDAHYGRRAAKLAHKLTSEHIRHSCRSVDRI